jgi:NAD(P)H-nitrite reductase large subunit
MHQYQYLIIGNGMTADAAVKGIRSVDQTGMIGIISNDPHASYKRPPLSKALWKGDPLQTIWLLHINANAVIHTPRTATGINVKEKFVTDEKGEKYTFEKLLLATGADVRQFPFDDEGIIYFRSLDDYYALRLHTEQGSRSVVIGGGFIGSEIAAALASNGQEVTMIFPEGGIGARMYPRGLSQFLNGYYASKGVSVLTENGVDSIVRKADRYLVRTKSGEEIEGDTVVAGLGVKPRVELAQTAGLDVDNGIVVNARLQTSHPDIYAAGDNASFMNPALGSRIRVEHEDNANTMGEHAGRNMAGETKPYNHLPFFYSDLFDLGYEAVGELDSNLETVEDWNEEFREGVVYYLDKQRVRGVLLWNVWEQVDNARALIAEKGPFTPKNLKGRIPG